MTYLEIDRPRRIDQFIDYFGDSRPAVSTDRPPNGGAAAAHDTRPGEAACERVTSADAFHAAG